MKENSSSSQPYVINIDMRRSRYTAKNCWFPLEILNTGIKIVFQKIQCRNLRYLLLLEEQYFVLLYCLLYLQPFTSFGLPYGPSILMTGRAPSSSPDSWPFVVPSLLSLIRMMISSAIRFSWTLLSSLSMPHNCAFSFSVQLPVTLIQTAKVSASPSLPVGTFWKRKNNWLFDASY